MASKVQVTFCLISFIFITSTNAQTNKKSEEQTEKSPKNIEQIEIVGQRPASYYRGLMIKAQDDFLDLYNNLTDNEDFKMSCEKHFINDFTRIKRRLCTAGYERNANLHKESPAKAAMIQRQAAYNGDPLVSPKELKKKKKAQLEDIKAKLAQSPELAEKYIKWLEYEQEYNKRKSQ